ncbi:MAG TPA: metal-dependent transcriptional regulator [Clostridiaceae bacterium]|nr:metal-dependent transcriptional regulator [Clostridiaceae bacterium]
MKSQESMENYLENIFVLSKEHSLVRSVDLAKSMGFSKPSVSRAVKKLKEQGLLKVEKNGNLKLTSKGLERAQAVYERHLFLTQYFMSLGVDETTAVNDACRMEHGLSTQTFELMKKHINHCAKDCQLAKEKRPFDFSTINMESIKEELES